MSRIVFITLVCCLLHATAAIAQTIVWAEDFETEGQGSRYSSPNEFFDAATDDDYFGRVRASDLRFHHAGADTGFSINTNMTYLGQSGQFYYAGEDLNDIGGLIGNPDGIAVKDIVFTGIDITLASDIVFKGLFARGEVDACSVSIYDEADFIEVHYAVDGAGEVTALCFNADLECNIPGDITNEPLHHDPNCDGDGGEGVVLTNTFQEFGFAIPGGNSLDLRISIHMDASSEEIAFDNFRLEATVLPDLIFSSSFEDL